MGLPCVAPDLRDERFLVRATSLEPAMAMKHLVHDSRGEARKPPLKRVKIRAKRRRIPPEGLSRRPRRSRDRRRGDRRDALSRTAEPAAVRLPGGRGRQGGATRRARGGTLGGGTARDLGQGAERHRQQAPRAPRRPRHRRRGPDGRFWLLPAPAARGDLGRRARGDGCRARGGAGDRVWRLAAGEGRSLPGLDVARSAVLTGGGRGVGRGEAA